jgi:muramoyltetrapeptide carboxypeptidase LdcA involved in peptidoglycan recycling
VIRRRARALARPPRLKPGDSVGKRSATFAESVRSRASDFNAAWKDPRVAAVFCVRGGFGSQHIADSIEFDLIRRNPKGFLGYSDITVLHLAIHRRTGLITCHGPVPLTGFPPAPKSNFRKALFGGGPISEIANPLEQNRLRPKLFTAGPNGLGETVDNLLADLRIPVLGGMTMGHTADQVTVPFGVRATLDAGRGTLRLEEAATS